MKHYLFKRIVVIRNVIFDWSGTLCNDLPPVLAHRLAGFALPVDDPVARAGAAAYQLLWPRATPAHRQQALDWWSEANNDRALPERATVEAMVGRLFAVD